MAFKYRPAECPRWSCPAVTCMSAACLPTPAEVLLLISLSGTGTIGRRSVRGFQDRFTATTTYLRSRSRAVKYMREALSAWPVGARRAALQNGMEQVGLRWVPGSAAAYKRWPFHAVTCMPGDTSAPPAGVRLITSPNGMGTTGTPSAGTDYQGP